MANQRISELPDDTTITGAEQAVVNDGGSTRRATLSNIKTYIQAGNRRFEEISTPSAPAAGYANMWAADLGGFSLPQWASAGGLAIPMAPGLFGKRYALYAYSGAGNGASGFHKFGCGVTEAGTQETAAQAANPPSDLRTMHPYAYMRTATNGASAGYSISTGSLRDTFMVYRSAISGAAGGFLGWCRFILDGLGGTAPTKDGVCVGFTQSQVSQPGGIPNVLALGNDAEDTNLSFIHNDDSGFSTKIDLGITPAYLNNKVVDLVILCERAGNAHFRAHILDTGEVFTATATSNLPVDGAGLYQRVMVSRYKGSGTVYAAALQGGMLEL